MTLHKNKHNAADDFTASNDFLIKSADARLAKFLGTGV